MTQAQNSNGTDQASSLPPFPAFPSASRYVPIGSVDEAMVRIGRSIDAKEAISLIMGPPGTGKSLICQTLTRRYENSHDVIVLGNAGIEDPDALLRHVLHCMGADHVAGPTNDLHLSLVDRVCSQKASHGGLLIIVDEAQSIPKDVFEAIRRITNIMQNGQPRVSAILCGGPKLDEVLVDPSMEAFTQRVATRCYLHPFSGDETREYITSIIAQCDADPDRTITLEAISAVHHACSGVPRLINQLMTQAIDVAEEMGQSMMDETVVDRAWAMLQQLPSPMIEQPKLKATSGNADQSVEYGELSDWDSDEAMCQPESHEECDISVASPSATWLEEEQLETAEQSLAAAERGLAADEQGLAAAEMGLAAAERSSEDLGFAEEESVRCDDDESGDSDQGVSPEAIAQIIDTAPPASALFGEFESEEHIPVGNAAPVNSPSDSTASQPVASQPIAATPQRSLESMLHQEIVGMTTHDDSAMVFADHGSCSYAGECQTSDCSSNAAPGLNVEVNAEANVQLHAEAEDSIEIEIIQSHEEAIAENQRCQDPNHEPGSNDHCSEDRDREDYNAGALRFVEEADADLESDPFEMRLVCDDSDLLVIEDELELQGEQKAPLLEEDREDAPEPISVDYQQLMSRMRTGS